MEDNASSKDLKRNYSRPNVFLSIDRKTFGCASGGRGGITEGNHSDIILRNNIIFVSEDVQWLSNLSQKLITCYSLLLT